MDAHVCIHELKGKGSEKSLSFGIIREESVLTAEVWGIN